MAATIRRNIIFAVTVSTAACLAFGTTVVDQKVDVATSAVSVTNWTLTDVRNVAQSFTVGITGDLVGVRLTLSKLDQNIGASTSTHDGLVQIVTLGNPENANYPLSSVALGSSPLSFESVGTAALPVEIDFASPIPVSTGDRLAIKLSIPSNNVAWYNWWATTSDVYPGGAAFLQANNSAVSQIAGDEWIEYDVDLDFSTLISVPTPGPSVILTFATFSLLYRRR